MPIRGVFLVPVQEVSVEAVNGTRAIAGALDADGVFLTFPRMDDCVDDFHGVQEVRGECKGKTGVKERSVLFNHGDVPAGSRDDIRGMPAGSILMAADFRLHILRVPEVIAEDA